MQPYPALPLHLTMQLPGRKNNDLRKCFAKTADGGWLPGRKNNDLRKCFAKAASASKSDEEYLG
jgi:hypothetical protein